MTERRHRYNTRQPFATCSGSQQLEILWTRDGRGESLAASSLKTQQTFLEGVGMVSTQVEPLEEVPSSENAEVLRTGTCGSVQYVLRFPSGTEYLYSGWPDFQFCQMFSVAERKLGKQVGLEESVRAVGEVQSPPGYSTEAKS